MQQSNPFRQSVNIRLKLMVAHASTAAAAAALVEGYLWWRGVAAVTPGHWLTVTLGAGAVGALLGLWAGARLSQRIARTLAVSRAWLRGNLALRIDPADSDFQNDDDLSTLSLQLNLLAEQLEEDEQDLEELRERNMRLTDQVRALAVVEERNRLARELHDSVKQHLFSLSMTAGALRTHFDRMDDINPALSEMVQEIEIDAQNAQRETTRLIEDLRPGSLQEQGLAKALNDYALLFGAQEHLLVYLDVVGLDERGMDDESTHQWKLPPSVTEALYRVTQEALHNVARHARATRVDIHLHIMPERVTLSIEDNGIGFDSTLIHRGMGTTNMQERVMAVGGRLTIKGQAGIGTTVFAEVALPHPMGMLRGKMPLTHPIPEYDNWAWLGQKLVIPVGQPWPWLPANQVHLREPMLAAREQTLRVRKAGGLLSLTRGYVLQYEQQIKPIVRFHHSRNGYEWEFDEASWDLRSIRGASGGAILTRNQQVLAAVQYQGRQMNTWTEIVYDNHGYRLSYMRDNSCNFLLTDENNEALFCAEGPGLPKITLRRPLPLMLVMIAITRILDELAVAGRDA